MKNIFILFLLVISAIELSAQRDSLINRSGTIPLGFIPPPPAASVISYVITTHSSGPGQTKIYLEEKIYGNVITDYWINIIRNLPRGSTITYSQMTVVQQNGFKKYLPVAVYTVQ
jgi:hypothetical protein